MELVSLTLLNCDCPTTAAIGFNPPFKSSLHCLISFYPCRWLATNSFLNDFLLVFVGEQEEEEDEEEKNTFLPPLPLGEADRVKPLSSK